MIQDPLTATSQVQIINQQKFKSNRRTRKKPTATRSLDLSKLQNTQVAENYMKSKRNYKKSNKCQRNGTILSKQ